MNTIFSTIKAFCCGYGSNVAGSTAMEYALVAAGVALAIVVTVLLMGDQVVVIYTGILNEMTTLIATR